MLPQNSSNVNIECVGKQLYSLCDQLLGILIYVYFIILILICFSLMMAAVNYVAYGCSSSRRNPGNMTVQELYNGGKTFLLLLKIG